MRSSIVSAIAAAAALLALPTTLASSSSPLGHSGDAHAHLNARDSTHNHRSRMVSSKLTRRKATAHHPNSASSNAFTSRESSDLPSGWKLHSACISDDKTDRLLEYSSNFPSTLTPSVCASSCEADGYKYAAVQYGDECWCAHDLHYSATAGQPSQNVTACSYACSGDDSINCGGYFELTLYEKGSSSEPSPSASSVPSKSKPTSSSVPSSTPSSKPPNNTPSTPSNSGSAYSLIENISGSTFFSHFDFFTGNDPTNGLVTYLSESKATSAGLAYVDSTSGSAIMKVDSSTNLPSGALRNSVRVTSKKAYKSGLMVFDIGSMPWGCAVWPAMWTVGPNWPKGGEIDIIEGVNLLSNNQLTLHTGPSTSCNTSTITTSDVSTNLMSPTCASSPAADAGCGYGDHNTTAYGDSFNKAGGAVFGLLIREEGVSIYKWAKGGVPSDVEAGKPDPESNANAGSDGNGGSWGVPQALWPSSKSCEIDEVIAAQNIVFDITLCGGWAESDYPNSGCPGTCQEQVMTGSNFKNAAWVVNSVKIYQ